MRVLLFDIFNGCSSVTKKKKKVKKCQKFTNAKN